MTSRRGIQLIALVLVGCSLLAGGYHEPLKAQGVPTQAPIFSGTSAQQLWWSSDSRYVAFFDQTGSSLQPNEGNWEVYDTKTKALKTTQTFPLLEPKLNGAELQRFEITTPDGTSPVFWSPDERYLVYAGNMQLSEEGTVWHLLLGDRQTQQVVDTMLIVYDPFQGKDSFYVVWNKTSSAFTLVQTGPDGNQTVSAYVSSFNANIAQFAARSGVDFENFPVGGQTYHSVYAYALSDDGSLILVAGLKNDPNNPNYSLENLNLLIYNLIDASKNIVIPNVSVKGVMSADFGPGSGQLVTIVYTTGLLQYDLSTGSSTVLNAQFNSGQAITSAISPDRQWLATIGQDGNVYIINIVEANVQQCVTEKGLITSLTVKINGQQWNAFINEVQAQSGKKITIDCATELIKMATYLFKGPLPNASPTPKSKGS
jgi:WD40 repeat protein